MSKSTEFTCCSVSRLDGVPVAVRLVPAPEEQPLALREIAVYEHLSSTQGQCIPRLVAHGLTQDGKAYYIATEYVEVRAVYGPCKTAPVSTARHDIILGSNVLSARNCAYSVGCADCLSSVRA